jgi:exodeoxyribonuclease V alpha subunit
MRRGELGADNLNLLFQSWLNPTGVSVEKGGRIMRVGDKVMQIRNNYDKEVFNGDVGRIVRIATEERQIWVRHEGREVLYEANEIDELVLAYAMTVHKSQGSEYQVVVLPLHGQHFLMLRRNLLYTAVTRARSLVVVVGSERALRMAVQRNDTRARASRLCQRLQDPHLE